MLIKYIALFLLMEFISIVYINNIVNKSIYYGSIYFSRVILLNAHTLMMLKLALNIASYDVI